MANELSIESVMFEAADPVVFAWCIKHYGPGVDLFVDHSHIVQLDCLRAGHLGDEEPLGRVVTYKAWRREDRGGQAQPEQGRDPSARPRQTQRRRLRVLPRDLSCHR